MTTTDRLTLAERRAQIERLPETSPLAGALRELVAAEDPSAVASDHGLDFRPDSYTVGATIELEPGESLPDGYRVEVRSQTGAYVTAYVHLDDLVPLALDEAVRKVQKPPDSRPTG